jgi:hypothetical protein
MKITSLKGLSFLFAGVATVAAAFLLLYVMHQQSRMALSLPNGLTGSAARVALAQGGVTGRPATNFHQATKVVLPRTPGKDKRRRGPGKPSKTKKKPSYKMMRLFSMDKDIRPTWLTEWLEQKRQKQRHLAIYTGQLLEAAGISYWLRSGNLLSLIRNRSFTLSMDDDVDFGVLSKDIPKVMDLIPKVAQDGHVLMVGGFGHEHPKRMAKLFFHHFGGNQSCYPPPMAGCYGLSAPTHADIFFMDLNGSVSLSFH